MHPLVRIDPDPDHSTLPSRVAAGRPFLLESYDDQPTQQTLERHRSIPAQGSARTRPANAGHTCCSVGFLCEATVSTRSHPKLRHHAERYIRGCCASVNALGTILERHLFVRGMG